MLAVWITTHILAHILRIGSASLYVEIAKTDEERYRGLSGRASLAEDAGMLFVCERPQVIDMWMKDTTIPLSVGFFDENQRLFQMNDMYPKPPHAKAVPTIWSKRPALYALEVNVGWFEKHEIRPGMKFSLELQ